MASTSASTRLLHDLRSQLNNISVNAELAKLELETPAPPDSPASTSSNPLACVESIRSACTACADILDALDLLSSEDYKVRGDGELDE